MNRIIDECVSNVIEMRDSEIIDEAIEEYGSIELALEFAVKIKKKMSERRIVYVAYTNTDCNEGMGRDVPIAVCAIEATAKRLARNRYVQGSDGPVLPKELVKIDGQWYELGSPINVIDPSADDLSEQIRCNRNRG